MRCCEWFPLLGIAFWFFSVGWVGVRELGWVAGGAIFRVGMGYGYVVWMDGGWEDGESGAVCPGPAQLHVMSCEMGRGGMGREGVVESLSGAFLGREAGAYVEGGEARVAARLWALHACSKFREPWRSEEHV